MTVMLVSVSMRWSVVGAVVIGMVVCVGMHGQGYCTALPFAPQPCKTSCYWKV